MKTEADDREKDPIIGKRPQAKREGALLSVDVVGQPMKSTRVRVSECV